MINVSLVRVFSCFIFVVRVRCVLTLRWPGPILSIEHDSLVRLFSSFISVISVVRVRCVLTLRWPGPILSIDHTSSAFLPLL